MVPDARTERVAHRTSPDDRRQARQIGTYALVVSAAQIAGLRAGFDCRLTRRSVRLWASRANRERAICAVVDAVVEELDPPPPTGPTARTTVERTFRLGRKAHSGLHRPSGASRAEGPASASPGARVHSQAAGRRSLTCWSSARNAKSRWSPTAPQAGDGTPRREKWEAGEIKHDRLSRLPRLAR